MSLRSSLAQLLGAPIKRRSLLQAAQVAGLGAAGAGLGLLGRTEADQRQVSGVCRICTMHCGLTATVRGKRLVRVEGDLNSQTKGFLCHHGWALPEIVHSPDRVRSPLKRDGSGFREISWDQALREISLRLLEVRERFGPEAVAVQTGWPFVRHPLIHLLHRFCRAFGTPNLSTVASLCEASGRMGKSLVAGCNLEPDLKDAKTLLVWGANPPITSPPFAHVVEGMSIGLRSLIVVDPVRTELAEKATLHLQVLPGTDGALALGLIHVVISEKLYDQRFIEEATLGFEALRELASRYPPDRVESLTSVPRARIISAARLFAQNGPGTLWDGLGVEHQENGVQTVRALTCLAAICGYLDVPGGLRLVHRPGPNFYRQPLPQLYRLASADPAPPEPSAKPIGYHAHPLYEVFNRQAQGMLFTKAILENDPYPIRALILIGCNPLVTWPNSKRVETALERLSMLVTVDPFLSESARRSDYVLPASTFAEAPVVHAGAENAAVASTGMVPEQHHSWPDWKILFALARELGLGMYFPWRTLQEAIAAPKTPTEWDPQHTLWPKPLERAEELPRFPSPSGKIELESETLARFGYPAQPDWVPPAGHATPNRQFPLLLVTGPRTRAYVNSQFRRIPSIAMKMPEPLVELHPRAALDNGLTEGSRVAVISPRGRIELRLQISDRIHPAVAVVSAGWAITNANLLTDDTALDPVSGFPAFRGGVCRIEKA